jgi:hypothetical protein
MAVKTETNQENNRQYAKTGSLYTAAEEVKWCYCCGRQLSGS